MMRIFIMVMAFALSSCATTQRRCPPLPQIDTNELVTNYVVRIIDLYNECAKP